MASEPVLRLEKINQEYGEGELQVRALQDVNLTVDRGELVAIMGPSGSGKSTLLSVAGGLQTTATGDVYVDGRRP